MPQIEIWALPGQPLKESDWLEGGYESLADYVIRERNNHEGHMKQACKKCMDMQNLPLVSFGAFNPNTGEKDVRLVCESEEDLPTENIEGVLIFN